MTIFIADRGVIFASNTGRTKPEIGDSMADIVDLQDRIEGEGHVVWKTYDGIGWKVI